MPVTGTVSSSATGQSQRDRTLVSLRGGDLYIKVSFTVPTFSATCAGKNEQENNIVIQCIY